MAKRTYQPVSANDATALATSNVILPEVVKKCSNADAKKVVTSLLLPAVTNKYNVGETAPLSAASPSGPVF